MSETSRQPLDRTFVERARSGDREAERALIRALSPIIRASVGRTMRRLAASHRGAAHDVEDVTQCVLLSLFARRDGAIARWDPDRGLDLPGFVSKLAAHRTVDMLRSRRRTEVPTRAEALDEQPTPFVGPEEAAHTRSMIEAVVERVRGRVSDRGGRIFELFFLQQRAPEDISALTGVALPAVHTWTSRLSRLGREVAAELEIEASPRAHEARAAA